MASPSTKLTSQFYYGPPEKYTKPSSYNSLTYTPPKGDIEPPPYSFSKGDMALLGNMASVVQVVRQGLRVEKTTVNEQIQELASTIAGTYQSLADLIMKLSTKVDVLSAENRELQEVHHSQAEASAKLVSELQKQLRSMKRAEDLRQVAVDERLQALESALGVQRAAASAASQAAADAQAKISGLMNAARVQHRINQSY